ncbi:hypothetical protein GCM10023200_24220 [Actinomycetospora chlora]|uniref:Secreted protein n=1 Tax=Actinomycetospora chlora TaxID=663608 RepID=A0ABP9B0B9_9PSEU
MASGLGAVVTLLAGLAVGRFSVRSTARRASLRVWGSGAGSLLPRSSAHRQAIVWRRVTGGAAPRESRDP